MSGHVDDKRNTNWLQQLRIGNKSFDDSRNIFFRDAAITIYVEKEKVVGILGDETLTGIIRPLFETPVTIMTGGKDINAEGEEVYSDGVKDLKPGDTGYIEAVLIERIRNQYGMEVE
jgi:hypothetical protein